MTFHMPARRETEDEHAAVRRCAHDFDVYVEHVEHELHVVPAPCKTVETQDVLLHRVLVDFHVRFYVRAYVLDSVFDTLHYRFKLNK
jgi:hypothetical protein